MLKVVIFSLRILFVSFSLALGASIQHNEREEPHHGWWSEEEACDEATTGGEGWSQEDFLCQLHRHLQIVRTFLKVNVSVSLSYIQTSQTAQTFAGFPHVGVGDKVSLCKPVAS